MIDEPFRPTFRLLRDSFLGEIVDEAHELLAKHGVYVENANALRIFLDGGAREVY